MRWYLTGINRKSSIFFNSPNVFKFKTETGVLLYFFWLPQFVGAFSNKHYFCINISWNNKILSSCSNIMLKHWGITLVFSFACFPSISYCKRCEQPPWNSTKLELEGELEALGFQACSWLDILLYDLKQITLTVTFQSICAPELTVCCSVAISCKMRMVP